jgi:hypothetical protein
MKKNSTINFFKIYFIIITFLFSQCNDSEKNEKTSLKIEDGDTNIEDDFKLYQPYFYILDNDTTFFDSLFLDRRIFIKINNDYITKIYFHDDSVDVSNKIYGGIALPFADSLIFRIAPFFYKNNDQTINKQGHLIIKDIGFNSEKYINADFEKQFYKKEVILKIVEKEDSIKILSSLASSVPDVPPFVQNE